MSATQHYIHKMDLRVPIHVALGHYEKLTMDQLLDHYNDIKVELERRGLTDDSSRSD